MIKKSLVALTLGTFALGISEFGMMGILSVLAGDLKISIPKAGDFISAYSSGVAVGAPCLLFLGRFQLKYILLVLCTLIAAGNTLVACSSSYETFLLGRFISGLPHGAYFGAGAILATRLAGYGEKASAVAIMVTGMTAANVAGVPLATWLTNTFTWRLAFFFIVLAAALAFAGIWKEVPAMPPVEKKGKGSIKSQFNFLGSPAPWLILAGVFFGQGAMYCWYSYVEPIMLQITHIPRSCISYVMMLAGTGMVIGGLVSGKLADRYPPGLVTCVICLMEIPVLLLIYMYSDIMPLSLALTFIGAGEIFALGGPLQYLIIRYSKGGEMLGGAMIQIAFNVSNAISAWLGGAVIGAGFGLTSPALAGFPLACAAAGSLFYFHKRYGIKEKDTSKKR